MKDIQKALKAAYRWGRDNGEGRSEKNYNDFIQTDLAKSVIAAPSMEEAAREIAKDRFDIDDVGGRYNFDVKTSSASILSALNDFASPYAAKAERLERELEEARVQAKIKRSNDYC